MNIIICGFGRAGKSLATKLLNSKDDTLVGVIVRDESSNAGKDIGVLLERGTIGKKICAISDAYEIMKGENIDAIIDFSHHVMAIPLIQLAGKLKCNVVICTTNHDYNEVSKFEALADSLGIGVVYAPNLTLGINLLIEFVEKISKCLPNFDFQIIEKHRKEKPPVTMTARIISQAIDRDNTPIYSVRAGGYVGIHEVSAVGENERITIEHESFSRDAFANGAMLAANFICGKKGLFLMKDVIDDLYK